MVTALDKPRTPPPLDEPTDPGTGVDGEVRHARACSGEAHGASWTTKAGQDLPGEVEVDVPGRDGSVRYRLARQPRTGRPVKDSQGAYLYLPVPDRRPGEPTPAAGSAGTAPERTSQNPQPEHPHREGGTR